MSRIRVLVVDDHPVVQEGLRKILALESDMEVVATVGKGEDAVAMVPRCEPDVVLMDLSLPGMNGIAAAKRILEIRPATRVVAYSMHDKELYVQKAFAAGAMGYVLKGAPIGQVTEAVRTVHRGGRFLCPSIRDGVVNAFLEGRSDREADRGYDRLSDREQQVFRLIVEGNSTKRIADALYISPKTVDKHRLNIMKKLRVSNLVQMVKYAIRIGVLDPDLSSESPRLD